MPIDFKSRWIRRIILVHIAAFVSMAIFLIISQAPDKEAKVTPSSKMNTSNRVELVDAEKLNGPWPPSDRSACLNGVPPMKTPSSRYCVEDCAIKPSLCPTGHKNIERRELLHELILTAAERTSVLVRPSSDPLNLPYVGACWSRLRAEQTALLQGMSQP